MSPRLFPVELDPVPNCLQHLDLQGEIKDHFDIKLSVAFEFLKKQGHFYSPIGSQSCVGCSSATDTGLSADSAGMRSNYLKKMVERIAALDQNSSTSSEHVQPDGFLFPNPSDSPNGCHTHQTPDDSITSFTSESFDFLSSWSNTIHSSDSTFPTFGSPNFTSTPFPQPPALPVSKGHDLAEASGVTKRCPMHVTQPNDAGYHVHILPSSILTGKKKQLVGDETGNAVQMKTMLHSNKDGVSVTNHIYLMTCDPGPVQSTRDAGYDRICGEIDNALVGLSLHHSTKDEIWCCIQQVEGY
ncbi:hypothetical protein DFH29DRAFT_874607 [Suillus ampliporus]|nr:hypothetical protein DFH29DRAFT_874607 [Suillus ampliporus]